MMAPTLRNLKHSRRYSRHANTLLLTLFFYTGGSNNLVLTLYCYTRGRHMIGHQLGAQSVLLSTRKARDRTTTWCSFCFVIHAEGT